MKTLFNIAVVVLVLLVALHAYGSYQAIVNDYEVLDLKIIEVWFYPEGTIATIKLNI